MHVRARGLGVVGLLVAVVPLTACHSRGTSARSATTTTPTRGPSIAAASVNALRSGRWSTLPRAPVAPRDTPAVVWTGRELIVWGGVGVRGPLYADGAAYDPQTGRWRVLQPSPLTPRTRAAAVWTGREMVIWGGQDAVSPSGLHDADDGAAYRPDTNTWRRLSPSPLSGRSDAVGVWTGSRVLVLGGAGTAADGATWDPVHDRWRHVTRAGPLADVEEAVWTGRVVIARGVTFSCGCPGPPQPEVTAAFDPARDSWTRLPPDPLERGVLGSASTGDALVSFDASPGYKNPPQPARASAYDPRAGHWTLLPPAPGPCGWYPTPFWTGRQILVFCAITWTDPASNSLALTVTRAGGAFTPTT